MVRMTFFFIPLWGLFITFYPTRSIRSLEGVCERVWDGDTLSLKGEKVRLAYIDAPEWDQRSRFGVPVGRESASFLRQLVEKKRIRVELLGKDIYHRWLGRVWVERDSEWIEVNVEMVLQGQAFAYSHRKKPPALLTSAGEVARLEGRGFWRFLGVQRPWNYRKKKR